MTEGSILRPTRGRDCNDHSIGIPHPMWNGHVGSTDSDKLEVVASVCCMGVMLYAARGCEIAATSSVKTASTKFSELLLLPSALSLAYVLR